MGKSKLKKKLKQEGESAEKSTSTKVPIENLPQKFLWMHVKSGTKIRNVLDYALKEFPNYNSIVWTGIGQGIAKAISCAELFKRKHESLHQVTKLCYMEPENPKEDITTETHQIPEVHILLTKYIKDTTELGYQAPDDCGEFPEKKEESKSMKNVDNMLCSDTELMIKKPHIGQKRNNEINNAKLPSKKYKKSIS
ncbi:ribonuclease P protein subunit p25-like protein isoform X2 [Camponotus floridanus]|nr:ribonuclease P protein subunit p25-like protein isoform X2 [Camponotus floridanus]